VPFGVRFGDDSAAYAANWRRILVIDAAMAVLVLAADAGDD